MQDVESLFIDANRAIEDKNISNAKTILQEILTIEPSYGRAHNYLAWIYETEIKDYRKALFHYNLAIKFSGRENPSAYINYVYLLLELQDFKKAETILNQLEKENCINPSILSYQFGRLNEALNKKIKALKFYKIAKIKSFDNQFCAFLEDEIKRIKSKMTFIERIYSKLF